ncbi:MAG: tetratricopeptide repeat protein [Pseudonocardiaceae bacterium]|nr:tetratricopeptide repeat protein [Pseudonocardiaceae bacterium]
MRFGVLGPLEVWTADGSPVQIPEQKVRVLLANLLAHEGRLVPAQRLADDIWDARQPANPAAALQRKVWQLRRALKDADAGGRDLVKYRSPGYWLEVGRDSVDALQFAALMEQARATDDLRARAGLLAEALALWRGPAFVDLGDNEFARAAAARLDEQRLAALEEHAEARLGLGEHGALIGELADLLAQHPRRERLRAAHMRALYRSGRQHEALASYRELRQRLADELGLDPSPDLVELHQAILEQDAALDAGSTQPGGKARSGTSLGTGVQPPLRAVSDETGDVRRTNIPASRTGLIGRAEAVGEVRALLDAGRLVTLTGPGGVGKTRLAIEVARRLIDTVANDAWLVELSGTVFSPAEAIATTLDIRDDTGSSPLPAGKPTPLTDRIADALRGRQVLLVLDGCEHVVEQTAELAEQLLHAVPGLRILATSQESLAISDERLWVVPPLEVPGPVSSKPEPEANLEPSVLEQFSAVELFVARAASVVPSFALDVDNARAVATLCRRLDGIPLALELAATRVRALGVHGLVERLDDRFRLLAAGYRGAPPRQQTLRAMLDWSWDLLTERERIVLCRLAVYADGCTLHAAEHVCAGEDIDPDQVLDLVARLVDRSLVVTTVNVDATEPRYRLLESVAAYCVQRLRDAGELERVRQRHSRYYTDLAERLEPQLRGHDQPRWLRYFDTEAANFRVALENAVQRGDADTALRLVNAMAWYWVLRGRLVDGRRSLSFALSIADEPATAVSVRAMAWQAGIAALLGDGAGSADRSREVLRLYEDVDDGGDRARAEWFLGFALLAGGDQPTSEDLTGRALESFRGLGDRWGTAAALSTRAVQAVGRGELSAVSRDGEQSLALFHELGDRWGQLQAMMALTSLAAITGDYQRAAELNRDGLRIAEDLGLWSEVSYNLCGLARVALLTGDYAQAEELHERARSLAAQRSDKPGELFAETGLALGARRQGKFDVAEAHLSNWLDWCRQSGWEPGAALILAELGFIAEQRGDHETAMASHVEAYTAARATGDPRAIALALEGLAGAQALADKHEHAARLLGTAAATRESAMAPLPDAERGDVDRITDGARSALGEEVFDVEFARGAKLSPDDHVRHPDLRKIHADSSSRSSLGDELANPSRTANRRPWRR